MGFWSIFALVTGSQIGSGVFLSPATLAPYGLYGLAGWIVSGLGAIALALVFAQLCSWYPKTGGPHVYVYQAFGPWAAFFTGWTYWVISWVSTTIVIVASVAYLTPIIGHQTPMILIILQIILLLLVTALNFRGVTAAGRVEFFLTILKIIPLILVPLLAFSALDMSNFMLDASKASLSTGQLLSQVTLLTLWGFIGLETATTAAESVDNPTVTIPRAVVVGTLSVALLYFFNSLGIMGAIPGSQLMSSNAPYADVVRVILGGNWHLVISAIASLVCIGTLNAWMLTSGQIALGLAQDRLVPAFFGTTNRFGASIWGLGLSCAGLIPLLIMTANENLAAQVLSIIDISVTAFLFVYIACCLAFFKILWQRRSTATTLHALYGLVALLFCCWVISQTSVSTIAIASLFTLSGIPFFIRLLR
jgi:APA family basic amino acid/polyamine antiporter